MKNEQEVYAILADLTGEQLNDKPDQELFNSGLMDSMATVQLVMELEEKLNVNIPISEFERSEWDTPVKIMTQVAALQ